MTDKKLVLVGRIDQLVRNYFDNTPSVKEIMVKELMPLFIKKGIFKKDHRGGLPIRNLLRELDKENKLSFIKHLRVDRKDINRNWYFSK